MTDSALTPETLDPMLTDSVHEKLLSLFKKAEYEVVYPEGFSGSCCGMMFNTRGFNHVADGLADDLEASLVKASGGCLRTGECGEQKHWCCGPFCPGKVSSPRWKGSTCSSLEFYRMPAYEAPQPPNKTLRHAEGGKYPIVVDTSPCLANIKGHLKNKDLRWGLAELDGWAKWGWSFTKGRTYSLEVLDKRGTGTAIAIRAWSV